MADALGEAQRTQRREEHVNRYQHYREDPVGFGEEVLGEKFTEPIKEVLRSLVDNTVTVARSANATGKSHMAARAAIWFYMCYPEGQVYTTAAPPVDNLKRILWGEILQVVNNHPKIFSGHNVRTLDMRRGPRSFLAGLAIPMTGSEQEREAKFSGKHAPQMLFIVDEGDAVPYEVYKGIESCMSGGHVRMLIMFNPRDKIGPVYDKETNGLANVVVLSAFDHPNVVTGTAVIPGAVDRETTVRRINEWTRPLRGDEKPDAECFAVPEFLVGVEAKAQDGRMFPPLEPGIRKVINHEFFYMVLGQYPAQSEFQLIAEDWVLTARDRWDAYVDEHGETPPYGVDGVVGVDIAELGVDYNAACRRYGGFVPSLTTWSGLDVYETSKHIATLQTKWNIKTALVDGDGVGAGVAPIVDSLNGEENAAFGVKVSNKALPFLKSELGEFAAMRDQLWWAVREWLRTDPNAMLPRDPRLVEELLVPRYKVREDGRIKIMKKDDMRKFLKRSPDRADALCLTFAPFRAANIVRLGL